MNLSRPYATPLDPPPEVIARRTHLVPSVGSSYPADELLDAQQQWLAYFCPERSRRVAAGRIGIGQGFAQNALVSANIGTIGTISGAKLIRQLHQLPLTGNSCAA